MNIRTISISFLVALHIFHIQGVDWFNAVVDDFKRAVQEETVQAARDGSLLYLKTLLMLQADANATDHLGNTPLIVAAQTDNKNIFSYLLTQKIDLDRYDAQKYTALMWAVSNGNIKIAQELIQAGASLHPVEEDAPTVIDAAQHIMPVEAKELQIKQLQLIFNIDSERGKVLPLTQDVMGILLLMNIRFINQARYKHSSTIIKRYKSVLLKDSYYPLKSVNRFISEWQDGGLDPLLARDAIRIIAFGNNVYPNYIVDAFYTMKKYNFKKLAAILLFWIKTVSQFKDNIVPLDLACYIASF